jgi:hypothetical protein
MVPIYTSRNMTNPNQSLESTAKTDTSASRQTSQHEPNAADAEEQIRVRAYQLSVDRKGQPGDAMQDWLTAEREYYGSASRV